MSALAQAIREVVRDDKASLIDIVHDAATRLFGPLMHPGWEDAVARSLARPSTELSPQSFQVTTLAAAPPMQILERDVTRVEVRIFNLGAATVHVGSHKVNGLLGDADAGYPILANGELRLNRYCGPLWAVAGAGVCDVRVFDQAGE